MRGSSGAGVPRSASRLIAAAPTARPPEHLRVVHQQREHRRLRLGAVDEGEALLRRESIRREPGRGQRGAAGTRRPVVEDLALAHERQRDVAERRQVAAGADASLLRHRRHEPALSSADQRVDQRGPDAAGRAEQHVGAQQHQPPDDFRRAAAHRHPAAWLRIRLTWSCSSWSGAIRTFASLPKPVLMPRSWPEASARSTRARLASSAAQRGGPNANAARRSACRADHVGDGERVAVEDQGVGWASAEIARRHPAGTSAGLAAQP